VPRLNKPQLILALDVDTLESTADFVDKLYPEIKIFKVGCQLFTAYGPKIVELIHNRGAEVFLDLKYLDIPNTIANAVAQAGRLKVKMLTLHIAGGKEMIAAAAASVRHQEKVSGLKRPLLIGVTVLTSQKARPAKVLKLARQGLAYGLDGVVCSAREAAVLRKEIKNKFLIITPGIRTSNSVPDDQQRTAAVKEAVQAGSNFLVIGRPILKAADPIKKAEELLGDLYGAGN